MHNSHITHTTHVTHHTYEMYIINIRSISEITDMDIQYTSDTTHTSQKTYTQQAATTGQKNNGNKASGNVTVTNCTGADVTIPAGTGLRDFENMIVGSKEEYELLATAREAMNFDDDE